MEIQQNIKTEKSKQIHIRYLTSIKTNPQPILDVHFAPFNSQQQPNNLAIRNISKLYITRQNTIQIFAYDDSQEYFIEQIFRIKVNIRNIKRVIEMNQWIVIIGYFQIQAINLNECSEDKNWDWEVHPYTTQLINADFIRTFDNNSQIQSQILYTYHQNQCMMWWIDSEGEKILYKYLPEKEQPYHINSKGNVEGKGKKIQSLKKGVTFTCCKLYKQNQQKKKCQENIFVGDSEGSLHIYDSQYVTHILTVTKHMGPILSICTNEVLNTVYWSGSDSKICSISKINNQWVVTSEVRGQSHDVLTLELCGPLTLLSTGINTDLCFYKIEPNCGSLLKNIKGSITHRVSYSNQDKTSLVQSKKAYLLTINRYLSFQIWSLDGQKTNLQCLYQVGENSNKIINNVKISDQISHSEENQSFYHLVVMLTCQETICFKYTVEGGLQKHFTISHPYQFIQFSEGPILIALRDNPTQQIQRINCLNGKITSIIKSSVPLPTQFKIHRLSDKRNQMILNLNRQDQLQENVSQLKKIQEKKSVRILMIGSKITNQIVLINLKTKKLIRNINCNDYQSEIQTNWNLSNIAPYQYFSIDTHLPHPQLANQLTFIIKFIRQTQLTVVKIPFNTKIKKNDKKANIEQEEKEENIKTTINIGLKKIRYGGWIVVPLITEEKSIMKKYFYGVSQGKIIFISNLTSNKKKKIRTKQIERIGGVAGIVHRLNGQNGQTLVLIGMNLRQQIDQGKGAIVSKKIYQ